MAVPTLASVSPSAGPASGGDLVRLHGTSFAGQVAIRFGSQPALVVAVREESGDSVADVRTPAVAASVVDVELQNLDAEGAPVPGELAVLSAAYQFLRSTVARESDLTRAVRQLLRELTPPAPARVSAAGRRLNHA